MLGGTPYYHDGYMRGLTPISSNNTHNFSTNGDGILTTRGGGGYTERLWHGQVVGGKDQGARLPGSGDALAPRLFAKIHPTWTPKPDNANIRRRT